MRALLPVALTLLLAHPGYGQDSQRTMLVRVTTGTFAEEAAVRRALPDLDIVRRTSPLSLEALVHQQELEELRSAGFSVEVVHRDLAQFYAQRLQPVEFDASPTARTGLPLGSMGGYLTYDEINALLDTWRQQYPNLITARQSIGKSVEGRDQWIVKVSANADADEAEPEIFWETLIHAREPGGMMSAMRTVEYLLSNYGTDPEVTDLLDNRELWYLPVMNVDGYEYNRQTNPGGGGLWRKNRQLVAANTYGVDLNRNFGYQWGYDNRGSSGTPTSETYRGPSAFSEPEARNVRDFITARTPLGMTSGWDLHAFGQLCMWPWGYSAALSPRHLAYQEMTREMTRESRSVIGTIFAALYAINGGAADWFEGGQGLWGWLPEIGEDFWPITSRILALAEENVHMLVTSIKYAGPYLEEQRTDWIEVGDGDGVLEPGERVQIVSFARNLGVQTANNVRFELRSPNPFARVEIGSSPLGNTPMHTDVDNSQSPLQALVPSYTAPGTRLPLELTYRFDGHVLRHTVDLVVGQRALLVRDPCETRSWTTGLPGDTAVRGQWTWGDPNPTFSHPAVRYAVQSGNDHTPDGGVNCYITGNQQTTLASADDVDGGHTTLLSPVFDLSTARNPYIQLWYWFVDHGRVPQDDVLEIAVTSDGQSWVPVLQETRSRPEWQRLFFRLRDYVTPSATVQLRVIAADAPDNSDCEAAIDDLRITDYDDGVRLTAGGPARIGQTVALQLQATRSANQPYATAVALGTSPGIALPSGRVIPLNPDPLFATVASVPAVFQNFVGQLDAAGNATAGIAIPASPSLIGTTLFAAFVTGSPGAPEGIADISPALPLTIQ